MMRAYVDTNVILRFMTGKPEEVARQARSLFSAAERGEIALILDEIVVAEVVWVLSSFYKFIKSDIKDALQALIVNESVEMKAKADALLALSRYADMNIDFEDALISVHMNRDRIKTIYTFENHFKRLPGITRLTPGVISPEA